MSKTRLDWTQEADKRREGLVALRRDFHRHPELSFQEQRTAQIIAERLQAAGLEVRAVAGTGVVGVLRGDLPGKTVAWRADTDALPLTEVLEATPPSPSPWPRSWPPGAARCPASRCSSSSPRRKCWAGRGP